MTAETFRPCANQWDGDVSCTSPGHAEDAGMALFLLRATGCRDDPEASWEPGKGYKRPVRRREAGQ